MSTPVIAASTVVVTLALPTQMTRRRSAGSRAEE